MKDFEKEQYFSFNLNHKIKVKLLPKGYQYLADIHNKLYRDMQGYEKRSADYYKGQADADGYTTLQAWEFIDYFGAVTYHGSSGYFLMSILIDKADLKEVE